MKQLQKDTTTPEQSQRLLELGVPADSANYYVRGMSRVYAVPDGFTYTEWAKKSPERKCAPIWSVGRLMEIIDICALGENSDPNTEEYPSTIKVMNKLHIIYIEYLVKSMERAMQLGMIDFSKLED